MAKLDWSSVGHRYYEAGVDHGVLYVGTQPGVAWSGLISVSENPSGGEPKPFYYDGVKYVNLASAEEYEAVVRAFSSPREFFSCDGMSSPQNGLFVTHQARQQFGFSYRVNVGNDLEGTDYGYKIHLVYNAITAPAQKDNTTIGATVDPTIQGWSITTLPPPITGYKPTAHLILESTSTKIDEVEDVLYGSDLLSPRLPTPDELIAIVTAP